MSNTIDSKVVEMQFDNRQFESNVSQSVSTLDKLKRALHLDGASKGLEGVGSAAKNVDMSGLSNSVETVRARFSALDVIGTTALANITNSAVNAGKKIVSALTIDPIKSGLSEYEQKLGSVQTIMAATGESIESVNGYLEDLNKYSDQTIYSFSDMKESIAKFTNAGVDLDKAVLAIKGISNEAAVSGATTQEAARAMYNFSQALSSGYVKLIDWKSIENANMATVEFKNELIKTAVELGTVTEAADGMYNTLDGNAFNATKNFNDVLQDQWMTTDVLIKTLERYADETTDIGKKAYAAAKDVKSLSQMWDIMKETAQSGWAVSWEIIFGNLEQAKAIFTPLNEFFGGIIDGMSNFRNTILRIAFDGPFAPLIEKIQSIMNVGNDLADSVSGIGESFKDLDDIVQRVIRGEFGNVEPRWKTLTDMGYNWREVQNAVNEELGCSFRYTVGLSDAQDDLADSQANVSRKQSRSITQLLSMTDAQLVCLKYTREEIDAIRELGRIAEQTGFSVEEILANPDILSGRSLLTNAFKNFGNAIVQSCTAIKTAWTEMFPSFTAENIGTALYNIIAALHKLSARFKDLNQDSESMQNLKDTFKGLFAILDLVLTIVGGPIKWAFKALTQILGMFDLNILSVTGAIGRAIVSFRDWIKENNVFAMAIEAVVNGIQSLITNVQEWWDTIKDSENLPKAIADGIVASISYAIDAIKNFFAQLGENIQNGFDELPTEGITNFANRIWDGIKLVGAVMAELGKILLAKINEFLSAHGFQEISEDSIAGLVNGLRAGIGNAVSAIIDLGTQLLAEIKEVLGIHSPSTEFFEIGKNIIQGLLNGLSSAVSAVWEFMSGIGSRLIEILGNIDWGTVFAGVMSAAAAWTSLKLGGAFASFGDGIGEMFEGIGTFAKKTATGVNKVLKGVAKVLKGFGRVLNSIAFENTTEGIKNLAIALLILVGAFAVIALLMHYLEPDELWKAVVMIGALAGILAALALAMAGISKLAGGLGGGIKMAAIQSSLISLGVALLLMAATVKIIGSLDPEQAKQGFKGLEGLCISIIAVFASFGLFVKGKAAMNIGKVGAMLLALAATFLILTIVAKMIAGMEWEDLAKAALGIGFLARIVLGLIAVSSISGRNVGKVGGTILKIAVAMAALVIVAKLIAGMTWEDMGKAAVGLLGLTGIITLLILISKMAGRSIASIGGTILGISAAMLALTVVAKVIAGMTWDEMARAGVGLLGLTGIIAILMLCVKMVGNSAPKIALTLFAMAAAIGILATIAILLGFVEIQHLAKGIIAVGLLASFMALMIAACRGVSPKLKANLITMTVAIGVMAAALFALSKFTEPEKLLVATGAMSALIGMFAVMMTATRFAKNTKSMRKTLIMLLGVTVVLAAIVAALSFVDSANALPNVEALSLLMLAFSASMVILSAAGRISKTVLNALYPMLGIVAGLALILGLLNGLGVEASIPSAIALGVLLNAMAAAILILSYTGRVPSSAIGSMALLGLVVAELALILGLMDGLGVEASIGTVASLSVMLIVMTGVLAALSVIGVFASTATAGIAAMALLGLVIAELAVILGLMAHFDVEPSMETAAALSTLLLSMSAALVILGIVGLLGPAAFIGIAALATLIAGIGGLIVGIGALMTEFPQLEEFLNTGIPVIEQIGYAIGSFFGNIVGGFLGNLTSGLPDMATDLSNFMTNLQPFIDGAKNIDVSVIEGIGLLSGAIIALTVADFIAGINSFMGMGSSFADLGTELSQFMTNVTPFIEGAKTINAEMMSGVTTLAETILILTAANVLDGLTRLFTGGTSSLASFGAQLGGLGTNLNQFVTNLGTFSEDQVNTVTCAANAIKALASAAETLPNEGGLLSRIVGDNSISTFGSYLPALGTYMSAFVSNLGTFTEEQVNTVTCAANAIKALSEAAATLPNEGGWLGRIVGDNQISQFGAYLPGLGNHLKAFCDNLGTFSEEQVATVTCAADAIKVLAEAADSLPNEGGWLGKIVGDNSIAQFGAYLPGLGNHLAAFATNLGTFTEEQVTTIGCAADAIKAIADVAQTLPNEGGWLGKIVGDNNIDEFGGYLPGLGTHLAEFASNLGTFTNEQVMTVSSAVRAISALADLSNADLGSLKSNLSGLGDKLGPFGEDLAAFCTQLTSLDSVTITSAISNLNRVINVVENAAAVDTAAADSFANSLKNLGGDGLSKFIEGFSGEDAKAQIQAAAETFMDELISGIETKSSSVEDAAGDAASGAASAVGTYTYWVKFYNAGKYLVEGFAAGITAQTWQAKAKAKAMAQAAIDAAEEKLEINSPSKVGYGIGGFFGMGFVNAIGDYERKAYSASANMASYARKGLSNAVSKITDLINSDIDTQPTIRPVMDLSDVQSGVNAMGSMLNMNSSVCVMANVGTISSMMNRHSQNGANDDVVSAINGLRDKLNDVGNTSYNINGITYDDGSNISSAIETLVRAARIERRV